jgi:serine/threonine-protein kinase
MSPSPSATAQATLDRSGSRRTPTPPRTATSAPGWLSSSDSISHGRFAPGTFLDGRYRIIGLLGRGGMGEVYCADDLRLGQPVALKFLPEGLRSDPVRLAQFHNEVRTARQVSHPNVCRVHDVGDVEGLLFISMEYVDGEDLASSLRRIGRFPEDKAVEITRQLSAGLAAAHQRGVVHRDLKPANVMLDGSGRVRVMVLFDIPVTVDTSAWFFGNMVLLIAIAAALAVWGFYTSMPRAGRVGNAGRAFRPAVER